MRQQYHFRKVGNNTQIWDINKLLSKVKHLTPLPVALSDIAEFDEDWWFQEPESLPTPRSLAEHMKLVQNTDLSHPILLCAEGRLMDGMHRVVKAYLQGEHRILAIRLKVTPPPDYVNKSAAELRYD